MISDFFSHRVVTMQLIIVTTIFLGFSCSNKPLSCFNDNCVYLPNNQVSFDAFFVDSMADTTRYQIQLITSTHRFLFQNKLKYIVERIPNKRLPEKFLSESTTGFIESSERIWLHPPRTAQFKFITQLAPYPEVLLPIKVGDSLSGSINMLGNWGDWSGETSKFYLYVEKDSTLMLEKNIEKIYILKGCGEISSEVSCVKYLFSYNYGFVFWDYSNNKGQRFLMKKSELFN